MSAFVDAHGALRTRIIPSERKHSLSSFNLRLMKLKKKAVVQQYCVGREGYACLEERGSHVLKTYYAVANVGVSVSVRVPDQIIVKICIHSYTRTPALAEFTTWHYSKS